MQLIVILLMIVSVLTFLSGLTMLLGSARKDRIRSAWFFAATIFATCWSVSIATFLMAKPDWISFIGWHVNWTFISAIFIDVALLGYISWHEKYGKATTLFFLIAGMVLTTIIASNPSLLYTDIILASTGNGLVVNMGPVFFIYITFFCLLVPSVLITLFRQIIHSKSTKKRKSDLTLLIGFAISGTVSLIFNLILPLWRWDLVWLGPIAVSTTIIAVYYTVLKYRILNLSSIGLRILSYVVIIASVAIVYMIIFSLVFAALFRGSAPSTEVIILNFIMVLFFVALMPAMNELSGTIRSLIRGDTEQSKETKDGSRKAEK